jgi:hypothetical protein
MMGTEIARLWWWDPSPNMIRNSEEIRLWNVAANQHDNTRMGPIVTSSSHNHNQGMHTFELSSGQIVLGRTPPLSWDRGRLLFTLAYW